jgi:hypothetical protein
VSRQFSQFRHPETNVVRDALRQIVEGIRVEMAEVQ